VQIGALHRGCGALVRRADEERSLEAQIGAGPRAKRERERLGCSGFVVGSGVRDDGSFEGLGQLDELATQGARGALAPGHREAGLAHAHANVVEAHAPVVDRDGGHAAAAKHAQPGVMPVALEHELPWVVVEPHRALAAALARELGDRVGEVAQHAAGLRVGHARGHVRAVEEDVEDVLHDRRRRAEPVRVVRVDDRAEKGRGGRRHQDGETRHGATRNARCRLRMRVLFGSFR
jgi:hypothetical protein